MIRYKNTKLLVALLSAMLVIVSGCTEKLEEQPRSDLASTYFETPEGINAAVTAAYSYFRFMYGAEGFMGMTVFGTDEFTDGRDGGDKAINRYEAGLSSTAGVFSGPWNWSYTGINTCNGVIALASEAGLNEDDEIRLVAEAKYLRALYYFNLVQLYGSVTLNLDFITAPTTQAFRAPIADIYAAIISDLEDAVDELPDQPGQPGRAFKGSAMHLLAKVYLTRAGYNIRANGCAECDDYFQGVAQPDDYEKAYEIASELIRDRALYGLELLEDYGDVHAIGNEHNSEIIWTVERNDDVMFNMPGVNVGNPSQADALRQNRSSFFFRPLYESVPGLVRSLEYGRPWLRFKPTNWLFDHAFAERDNDSRYDKTFQTVWLGNNPETVWLKAEIDSGYAPPELIGLPKVPVGDTALWFPGYNMTLEELKEYNFMVVTPEMYREQIGNRFLIWPTFNPNEPNQPIDISQYMWPSMKKYDDTERPDIENASVRPYIVHKLSETYLIAAEAAYMLEMTGEAAEYINVIRRRAAFRSSNSSAENDAAALAMEVTAGDIDIDFILDERTRELVGESMRWFDLVRTGKLLERVKANHHFGGPNIQPHHVLRPIPQGQIDLTSNPYGQNPNY